MDRWIDRWMDGWIDRWIVQHSNHLAVHQWIRSAIRDSQQPSSPIGFLFLKLPPPPCAVLLVSLLQKEWWRSNQQQVGRLVVRMCINQQKNWISLLKDWEFGLGVTCNNWTSLAFRNMTM